MLADLVGRTEDWLSKIERGEREIRRLDVLADVARGLRVTLGDLLGEPVLMEDVEEHDDVPAIRDALMAPRRLSKTLFSSSLSPEYIDPGPVAQLTEGAWAAYQRGDLGRVVTALPGLIKTTQQMEAASAEDVAVCFAHLSAIFTAAVDDKLIVSNPCYVKSVTRPKLAERKIKPWSRAIVKKVHMALDQRFKIIVPIGAGCGLRQGEIFGLGVDQIDRDGLVLHVVRQLREVRGQFVFAPPKRGKSRDVPLSRGLLKRLDDHIKQYPPVTVTLPWREPNGDKVAVDLLITNANGYPLARRRFNPAVWQVARKAAGITNPTRDDGMHALRHHYASVLLDAGESIKALSEYLGHSDPGFTLRTYTHLMPSSAERTRRAVDQEWGAGDEPSDGLATA